MKLGILSRGLIALTIGGTLLVGSVAWNGSNNLTAIKDALTSKQSKLELFKDNETKLIAKVNELKGKVTEVTSQLETLQGQAVIDQEKIQALETEKAGLLSQISELESQLEGMVSGEEAESLRNEITRLEGELTKANTEVEAVKQYLDTLEDITPSDISAIVGEEGEEDLPTSQPTFDFKIGTTTKEELNQFLTDNGGQAKVKGVSVSGGTATIQLDLWSAEGKEFELIRDGLKNIPTGSKITSANGNPLYTWN